MKILLCCRLHPVWRGQIWLHTEWKSACNEQNKWNSKAHFLRQFTGTFLRFLCSTSVAVTHTYIHPSTSTSHTDQANAQIETVHEWILLSSQRQLNSTSKFNWHTVHSDELLNVTDESLGQREIWRKSSHSSLIYTWMTQVNKCNYGHSLDTELFIMSLTALIRVCVSLSLSFHSRRCRCMSQPGEGRPKEHWVTRWLWSNERANWRGRVAMAKCSRVW